MSDEKYPSLPEEDLEGLVRTNLDSPAPTQAQLDRKARFTRMVANMGLPSTDNLPVVEDAASTTPRDKEEIARRSIAVAIAAVKGEGMPQDEVMGIVNGWDVISYFSDDERQFIENPDVTDQERAKFSWRYECLDVLLWAMGYKDVLPPPNEICNVEADVSIVVENKNMLLAENASLRSLDEILDMADYYYRLHWAAIELRLAGESNDSIDEEIIMERHYALNWLIRYMDQAWDDVSTDT